MPVQVIFQIVVNKVTLSDDRHSCQVQLFPIAANEIVITSLFGSRCLHIQQDLSTYEEMKKPSFIVMPLALLAHARPHLLITHFVDSSRYLCGEDVICDEDSHPRQVQTSEAGCSSSLPALSTYSDAIAGPSSGLNITPSLDIQGASVNRCETVSRDADSDIIDLTEDCVDSVVEFSDVEYLGYASE